MSNREEMDKLLDVTLNKATFFLEKNGEFYPFAQALDNKDQIIPIASYDGNEHPKSQEVIELLEEGLKKSSKEKRYKVVAICIDMKITIPKTNAETDAIQVRLEHENQDVRDVYLPYKKTNKQYEYGELFAMRGNQGSFLSKVKGT